MSTHMARIFTNIYWAVDIVYITIHKYSLTLYDQSINYIVFLDKKKDLWLINDTLQHQIMSSSVFKFWPYCIL